MDWFSGTIPDAILEVKNTHKILLVFVIGDDDLSKQMFATFNDPKVSEKLNSSNCVALKLEANTVPYQQFCQIYPVVVIPSSFFIGKNGLPIEIITGSVEPDNFLEKINNIFQLNEDSYKQEDSSQKQTVPEMLLEPMEASTSEASIGCEPMLGFSKLASQKASSSEASTFEQEPDTSDGPSVPLEERVQRAKDLLEAVRQTKAQEESEKEKNSEQERRKMGKAVQKVRETQKETELKEWAQNLAKDKEEEKKARERVRAQIAQDRAERAAQYKQVKEQEEQSQRQRETERRKEEQEKADREAAIRSTMARLQFRLPDGTSVTHNFSADATLGEARNFLLEKIQRTIPEFVLCSMFPRRYFTANNYAETLRDLDLAPSAALLVLPGQTALAVSNPGGSFYSNLFWTLISPLLVVWKALTSLFRGSPPQQTETPRTPPPSPSTEPGPSGTQLSASSSSGAKKRPGAKDESSRRGKSSRKKESEKFYKEGNVYRISNRPTDDDENNTWNGNSTQQM